MLPSWGKADLSDRWLTLAANPTSSELIHQCRRCNTNLKELLGPLTGSAIRSERAGDCRSFWMQDWMRRQRQQQSNFCDTPDRDEEPSQAQILQQNDRSWYEVLSHSEQRPYAVPPSRYQARWTDNGQERSVYSFTPSGVRSTMPDNHHQHSNSATLHPMSMRQGISEQGHGTKALTCCLYYSPLTTELGVASKNFPSPKFTPDEMAKLSHLGQSNTFVPREGLPNRIGAKSPIQKSFIFNNDTEEILPQFLIVPGDNPIMNSVYHGLPTPSTFTNVSQLDWPVAEPIYSETFPWPLNQMSCDEQDDDRNKMPRPLHESQGRMIMTDSDMADLLTTRGGEADFSPLYSDQHSPHSLFSSNTLYTPNTSFAPSEPELSIMDQTYPPPGFPSDEAACGRNGCVFDQPSTTYSEQSAVGMADRKLDVRVQDPRQRAGVKPVSQRSHSRDAFLIQCKRRGMSYKDIKKIGGFEEAESTLRGRFRTLTKRKEQRVRKPQWKEKDVSRKRKKNLMPRTTKETFR